MDMDLRQKFIEASRFDIDDWFREKTIGLPSKAIEELLYDIAGVVEYLPTSDGWSQEIYGVIYSEHIFYVLEYLKQEEEIPLIIDIDFIESDEYLDAHLEKKTIKSYYNEQQRYNTNEPQSTKRLS